MAVELRAAFDIRGPNSRAASMYSQLELWVFHALSALHVALWALLLRRLWNHGINRSFPEFSLNAAWEILTWLLALGILLIWGLGSSIQSFFYSFYILTSSLMHLLIVHRLCRMAPGALRIWVWTLMLSTGGLMIWQMLQMTPRLPLVTVAVSVVFHLQVYLIFAAAVLLIRHRSSFRAGLNAVGILSFVTISAVQNYFLHISGALGLEFYPMAVRLHQPVLIGATLIAYFCCSRLDLPGRVEGIPLRTGRSLSPSRKAPSGPSGPWPASRQAGQKRMGEVR